MPTICFSLCGQRRVKQCLMYMIYISASSFVVDVQSSICSPTYIRLGSTFYASWEPVADLHELHFYFASPASLEPVADVHDLHMCVIFLMETSSY